jgi:hypothetical protein
MELRRGSSGRTRMREDLEVAGAEPARWERAKNARGSGLRRCGAAWLGRARVCSSLSASSMASRASSHGSTKSSARRGAAVATDGDAATLVARRARKEKLCSGTWRFGWNWTGASAGASGSVLPVAGSARFRGCARVQGNRPRASRLRASGAGADRERSTGAAARYGGPAGGYAGVPAVFQRHTRMSRGDLAREQEDREVRGGVGLANQSGSIVSSHKSTASSSSYSSLIARARPQHLEEAPEPPHRASSNPFAETSSPWQKPTTVTTYHRGDHPSGHSPPTTTPPRQAFSSPAETLQSHLGALPVPEPRHRRALLTADPIRRGNSLSARSPLQPRLLQSSP